LAHIDPIPRYSQIKRMISARIQAGDWRPGDRIASESELVRDMGVSRMTINRALRELTMEGQLIRVQGVGTFVAENKAESALFEVRNIADEIKDRGGRHEARVILLRSEPADEAVERMFGVKQGDEIFHSILLHLENEIPMQIEDRVVDPRVAKDYLTQDFTKITPHVYLNDVAPISDAEHAIEAVFPRPHASKLLKIPSKEPCICLHRRTWSDGRLVSSAYLVYPGSRYRLSGRFKA
jgi:GntR family transcriptional regulator, histidine utilization repressor